jgi:7-carboxy-7-deazaguanine synthase
MRASEPGVPVGSKGSGAGLDGPQESGFLRVTEIFHSIQGESTWAGLPCTFVRLTGCPLRCVWCDTAYAFHGGERMSLDAILEKVDGIGCELVEITALDPRVHKIMDLKCPGSGEEDKNLWSNLEHLTGRDEVKFVVADRIDYEWMRATIRGRGLADRMAEGHLHALLVSPVWENLHDPAEGGRFVTRLVEWMLKDDLPVRLQLQLHKLIWSPDTRGV